MITGRILKEGPWFAAEAPVAGVFTQGRSRANAKIMLADAFAVVLDQPNVELTVSDFGDDGGVLIEANEPAVLAAYVLRYQREAHGLTLAQVAAKLGASSRNAYARYEQGRSTPTIDKLYELLAVVAPDMTLVVVPRTKQRA